MKTKLYTIDDSGTVIEVDPFSRGLETPEVHAGTKAEATKLFLQGYRATKRNTPTLRIENGAFLLVWHNGHEFIAEGGTIDRARYPLCLSGHPTQSDALENGGAFKYYASAEYQASKTA